MAMSTRKYNKHRKFKKLSDAKKYASSIRKKGFTGTVATVTQSGKVWYKVYKYS